MRVLISTLAMAAVLGVSGCAMTHKEEKKMADPAPTQTSKPMMEEKKADMMEEDSMMEEKADMMEEDSMMEDEMMEDKAMSADDAAMNACFEAGGQITSWDVEGADPIDACRLEDGTEYALRDSAYFAN